MFGSADSNDIARLTRRVIELEEAVEFLARRTGIAPEELARVAPGLVPPQEVLDLLAEGKEVAAIKRYREITGADLVEAKLSVDALKKRR